MKKTFLSIIFHASPWGFMFILGYFIYLAYRLLGREPNFIDLIIGMVLFYPVCVFFHRLCQKYWLIYVKGRLSIEEAWSLYEKNISLVEVGKSLEKAREKGAKTLGKENI